MSSRVSSSISQRSEPLTIEQLTELKRKYINNLDFAKAKLCEDKINQLKHNRKEDAKKYAEREIREGMSKIHEEYLKSIQYYKEGFVSYELEIRERYDNAFQDMQSRHIKDLIDIEKQYALEVIKSKNRRCTESDNLKEQAKKLANGNNFDDAMRFKIKAEKALVMELEMRRAKIDAKYDTIRRQIFDRQKNELLILSEKLQNEVARNDQGLEAELLSLDKIFNANIIAHQQNVASNATKRIPSHQDKKQITDFINNLVKEIKEGWSKPPLRASNAPSRSQSQIRSVHQQSVMSEQQNESEGLPAEFLEEDDNDDVAVENEITEE